MSEQEHYFTAEPASAADRRPLRVRLAGRKVEVEVAGGVFSPGAVDTGTGVLLAEAPRPPADGTFLDLGCGWGPDRPDARAALPRGDRLRGDVNERALDLCRRNAATLGLERVHAVTAGGVPDDVRFDVIWSNPPIRVGKAALHDLLATWLPRLAPDGVAYLVVQKNLGSDSLQRWVAAELGLSCSRLTSVRGFRVLEVRHPG